MFTLPVVGALLVGALNGHVFASSVAHRDGGDGDSNDALLHKYTKQLADLNATSVGGIQCYKQYVPRVQKKTLPAKDVLERIRSCNDLYDKASKQLRDVHNTANEARFPPEKLAEKKLPNVLNYRESNTQGLQRTLEQLRKAAADATAVYNVKKAAEEAVARELAKPLKEQVVDVSKKAIRLEKDSDGNIVYAVEGVITGSVLIAGTITYAPFTEAAVAVGDATETAEEAVQIAAQEIERVQDVDLDNVAIGQLRKMSGLAEEDHDAVEDALHRLDSLGEHMPRVPQAEMPETSAIYHASRTQANELDARLAQVSNAVDALKNTARQRLL